MNFSKVGVILLLIAIIVPVSGFDETDFLLPEDILCQAKCQASCYDLQNMPTKGSIPYNNRDVEIEECRNSFCEKCLDLCATKRDRNFTCEEGQCEKDAVHEICETQEINDVVSVPLITCKNAPYGGSSCPDTVASMYIRWSLVGRLFEQDIKPIFVLSSRYRSRVDGLSEWSIEKVVTSQYAMLNNLHCFTDYQFQVTVVYADGRYSYSRPTVWSTTPGNNYRAPTPHSMDVSEPILINQRPSVTVTWDPGKDASCYFKIYWFDPKDVHQAEIKTPGMFRFMINNLDFSKNYTIRLYSTDETFLHTSAEKIMHVLTPDCLEATGYNHSVCAPLQPNNLSMEVLTPNYRDINVQYVNVSLTWDHPLHTHNGKDVLRYNVMYRKQPPHDAKHGISPDKGNRIFNGSNTSAFLPGLHNHNQYRFEIYAETIGGRGESAALEEYIGTSRMPTTHRLRSVEETEGESALEGSSDTMSFAELMAVVIVPTVLFIILIFVVSFIIFKRRQRYKKYPSQRRYGPVEEMNPIYDGVIPNLDSAKNAQFGVDGYEIDYSCLDFISVIGEGAFGKVVKAEYYPNPADRGVKEGKIVAVKMLRDFYTGDESRNFLLEIQSMKNLGHFPYIVSIIGCCLTGPKLCLVMDYCALGDLRNYLRKYREKLMYNMSSPYKVVSSSPNCYMQDAMFSRDRQRSNSSGTSDGEEAVEISEAQLLSYARQITMGMEFLDKRKFVHRDLAARNILLYDHRHVKISDFGLTRDVYETNVYQPTSARKLPYKWMAIESLFSQRFTVQSDVWSFGIVLWEIVTLGGSPYPSIPLKDLYGLLNDGYRMEKPENCSDKLYQIMLSCWHPNPHSRPSFTQLKLELEKLLEETMSYIDLSVEVSEDYFNESANDNSVAGNHLPASKDSILEEESELSRECIESDEFHVDVHNRPKNDRLNSTDDTLCSNETEHENDDDDYLQNLLGNTKCIACNSRTLDSDLSGSMCDDNQKKCHLCSRQKISKSADALKEKSRHLVKSHFPENVRNSVLASGTSSPSTPSVGKRVYSSLTDIVDRKGIFSTSV